MKFKYLVTGTGRSGTVFMARFLTASGFPCGHETFFDYHGLEMAACRMWGQAPLKLSEVSQTKWTAEGIRVIPEWLPDISKVVAESSYMAAPFLIDAMFDDTTILHVVRDPIKVINSFCQYLGYFGDNPSVYEQFIYRHVLDVASEQSPIARAARYYVLWNDMIERNCQGKKYHRIRLEDGPRPISEILGTDPVVLPTDINSFERPGKTKIASADIPNLEFLRPMAERYGYTI
jgi:hypothetical protein